MIGLTKIGALLICVLAAVTIADYAPHSYQFHIRAISWHALHGYSLSVAGYRIAVPSQWFAEELASDDAHLWNTKTGDAIWLRSSPKPSKFTLSAWSDFVQAEMNDSRNPIIARQELSIGGESFVCFERDFKTNLRANTSAEASPRLSHLPSVECNSAGTLHVLFFAGRNAAHQDDYSKFYSLMDSIQKDGP